MLKFFNPADILVIAISAYVVVWGANKMLRATGMTTYQA